MAPPELAAPRFAPALPDDITRRILDLLGNDARTRCVAACLSRDWRRLARDSICERWILHGERRGDDDFSAAYFAHFALVAACLSDDGFAALAGRAAASLPAGETLVVNLRGCNGLTLRDALHALRAAGLAGRVRQLNVLGLHAAPDDLGDVLPVALQGVLAPDGWSDVLHLLEFDHLKDSALRLCGRGEPPCDRLSVNIRDPQWEGHYAACLVCKALEAHPRPLRLAEEAQTQVEHAARDCESSRRGCAVPGCARAAASSCLNCDVAFCAACAALNLFSCSFLVDDHHSGHCNAYDDVPYIRRFTRSRTGAYRHFDLPECGPVCSACVAKGCLRHCAAAACEEHYEPPYCGSCYRYMDIMWTECRKCHQQFCSSEHMYKCEGRRSRMEPYGCPSCFCIACAAGVEQPDSGIARCSACSRLFCDADDFGAPHIAKCPDCGAVFCEKCVYAKMRICDDGHAWCLEPCSAAHFTLTEDDADDLRCDDCVRAAAQDMPEP